MSDRLIKSGFSSLSTGSLGAATVRNMIDNFGYRLEVHDAMPGVSPVLLQQSLASTSIIPGPGTPGFDPIPNLIPFRAPAGIVAPDWSGLVRAGIEALFGNNTPTTFQEGPLALPPQSPTPGLFPPGGLQGPIGGAVVPRTGGRAAFITMPNGMMGCPSGYHPEKQGKPYCVRNRRMNPLNPRALSRATRRVGGFARAVKRARTLKRICRTL